MKSDTLEQSKDTDAGGGKIVDEDLQEYQEGGEIPAITNNFSASLSKRWERALIIRILEPRKVMELIRRRMLNLWKIKGDIGLKELGFEFYIVHDLREDDRTQIITARPWRLGGTPILIGT